jgi:hypothetical protein
MSEPCVAAVVSDLKSVWTFLKSDEAHMVFAALVPLRMLVLLLLRLPGREATELARTIVVITLVLLAIAVQEFHPLARSKTVALCGKTETEFAAAAEIVARGANCCEGTSQVN